VFSGSNIKRFRWVVAGTDHRRGIDDDDCWSLAEDIAEITENSANLMG